jgi:TolB protein
MPTKLRPLIVFCLVLILPALACKTLMPGPNTVTTPLPSPESGQVATQAVSDHHPDLLFVTWVDGSAEIFSMQADGSNVVRMTTTDFTRNWNPAWSPDCSRIAFASDRADKSNFLIYVMDYGSDQPAKLLLDSKKFTTGLQPTWSPDGQQIAFSGSISNEPAIAIFVMKADGSQLERLTQHGSAQEDTCPAWSPDGKYIAYMNSPDGATNNLMVMKPDGSDAKKLYSTQYQSYPCPSWSPDSQRIVFVVAGEKNYDGDIAIINLDRSGFVNLTRSEAQEWEPDWSPDGKRIAYMIRVPGRGFEIHSMNIDGTGDIALTDDPNNDHYPDWCSLP